MLRKFSLKNIILILINGLLLLTIIIINILLSSRSAVLTIITVPSDATVKINGATYQTGTYKFFPGEITATIEKDGFDSKEIKMTLEPNANNRLFAYLTKDGSLSYIKDTPSESEILRQIANVIDNDDYLKSFMTEINDEQSLQEFLPIYYEDVENQQYLSFTFETGACKEKDYCILITDVLEGNHNFAINLLKKYGYASPNYEIIYTYSCKKGDLECARL